MVAEKVCTILLGLFTIYFVQAKSFSAKEPKKHGHSQFALLNCDGKWKMNKMIAFKSEIKLFNFFIFHFLIFPIHSRYQKRNWHWLGRWWWPYTWWKIQMHQSVVSNYSRTVCPWNVPNTTICKNMMPLRH